MSEYQHWYYIDNNYEEAGPVSSDVLSVMAKTGELRKDAWVWTQELPEWVPVSKVKGLFEENSPSQPHEPTVFTVNSTKETQEEAKKMTEELRAAKQNRPKATLKGGTSQPAQPVTPLSAQPAQQPVQPQQQPVQPAAQLNTGIPSVQTPVAGQAAPVRAQATAQAATGLPSIPPVSQPTQIANPPHPGIPHPSATRQTKTPTPLSSHQPTMAKPMGAMATPSGSPQAIPQNAPTSQQPIVGAPSVAGAGSIPAPGLPSIPAIGANSAPPAPQAPASSQPVKKRPAPKPMSMKPN